jgi:ABC-type bacteriocin/lantibiotic exporter with double-glycine peptidase domain
MPNTWSNTPGHFLIKRSEQISDAHCGPAVVQMLLSNLGVFVTQKQIAKAAGVEKTIEKQGTTVQQLAEAVHELSAGSQFWFKLHADITDIIELVNNYRYPVAVEWQGLFETLAETQDRPGFEDFEEDYGHYSIITTVDPERKVVVIVDPYKDFINQDRILSLDEFLPRWWDTNEVINEAGNSKIVTDNQMMFTVTRKKETFPEKLGMVKGEELH